MNTSNQLKISLKLSNSSASSYQSTFFKMTSPKNKRDKKATSKSLLPLSDRALISKYLLLFASLFPSLGPTDFPVPVSQLNQLVRCLKVPGLQAMCLGRLLQVIKGSEEMMMEIEVKVGLRAVMESGLKVGEMCRLGRIV
jgi:hypothetical protein